MNTPAIERTTSKPAPRAVRKQVAEANAILESLKAKPGEVTADPNPNSVPVTQTAPEPAPAPAPEPAPAPAPEPAPAPAPAPDKFKQMYEVLKGKYDKEVPELRVQVADLAEKLKQTEGLLAQLADRPASPVTNGAAELPKPSSFSKQEVEEYGPEFFDIVARRAQEVIDAKLGPLEKQLKEAAGAASMNKKVEAERARQAVFSALDDAVPNWRVLNSDQAFLAWLGDPDVFSGKEKRELLHQAFESNDAARVVGFFRAFQEDSARQATPTARTPSVDVGTLTAPGTPRSGSPAGAPGGNDRVWTQQEIADFYSQVSRKRISGEDRIRIEKEIVKAAAEGRVR